MHKRLHALQPKKKSLIVVRVHLINLFLFCQCRRYAVSSRRQKTNMDIHGNYMPWYAEERKRRGSDWRTARNSPRAQIQRILVWKWTEVSVVSFCFAWFSYVLSCEGAVPAMSSKTNRMSRREKKKCSVFLYYRRLMDIIMILALENRKYIL